MSPELESHSKRVLPRGEAGVGRKMPSVRRPQQFPQSQLGSSAPKHHLSPLQTPCGELHSGKVDSPRGTNQSPNAPLLSKATLALFSPSPLVSMGQIMSGLPLTTWPCCFAGGLLSGKRSPNMFSFVEKQELPGKCLLVAGPSNSPSASQGPQHRDTLSLRCKLHAASCILEG